MDALCRSVRFRLDTSELTTQATRCGRVLPETPLRVGIFMSYHRSSSATLHERL
jgi:hypothetical protein